MSLGLLARQPLTWDSEAAAYILQVEAADGQSLEPAVARAINTFVIDCKVRGIWGAIKSCCLLCGARTIAGATIPLKGDAPILTSFVGDYSRELGLKRTSGAFDINRNTNTDPQNNKHIAVYPSYIDYGNADNNFRSIIGSTTTSGSSFITINNLGLNARINGAANAITNQPILSGYLIGLSVNGSSICNVIYNNNNGSIDVSTASPTNSQSYLFGGSGVSSSSSRISFYSLGESLNLQLLNQCINKLNYNLWQVFKYNPSNADVLSYASRVEAIDGFPLPNAVLSAVDVFVTGCKNDNLWNSIATSCIIMGARTLRGAIVPLVGQTPISNNFIISDYDRKSGLIGNATNKYLNSNRRSNEDAQNNVHSSVYVSVTSTTGVGAFSALWSDYITIRQATNLRSRSVFASATFNSGFGGVSRTSSTDWTYRAGNITSTGLTTPSSAGTNETYYTHCYNSNGTPTEFSNARIAFYSIGSSLTLSLLDSRVTALYNSINSIF